MVLQSDVAAPHSRGALSNRETSTRLSLTVISGSIALISNRFQLPAGWEPRRVTGASL